MRSKEWNEHQKEAIAARDRSVVVSAAAGSGKTSVLTERVLRLIEEGGDIGRMLIVTFTNLAAGEMRERIYNRLQAADGARFAVQAEKCAFADISTIHAFCGRVIRDNFEQAGVSPTVAVADEAAIGMLRNAAMEQTLEQAAQDPGRRHFISKYSPRGDMQGIQSVLYTIYSRVISRRYREDWLCRAEGSFDSTEFVHTLFDEYKQMVIEAANSASAHLNMRTAAWRRARVLCRGGPKRDGTHPNDACRTCGND